LGAGASAAFSSARLQRNSSRIRTGPAEIFFLASPFENEQKDIRQPGREFGSFADRVRQSPRPADPSRDMDAFCLGRARDDPHWPTRSPSGTAGGPGRRRRLELRSPAIRGFPHAMSRAVRLCPDLVVIPPDSRGTGKCRDRSSRSFDPPRRWSSRSRRGYLDVTETSGSCPRRRGGAEAEKEIRETTGLTASAGVAPIVSREDRLRLKNRWLTVIARRESRPFSASSPSNRSGGWARSRRENSARSESPG
jgi:hypothetical protein